MEFIASTPGSIMQSAASIPLMVELGVQNPKALKHILGTGSNVFVESQ
jgi:hypothetical protein